MTLESLLRRRALRARYISSILLFFAATIPMACYVLLPLVVDKTVLAVVQIGRTAHSADDKAFDIQLITIIALSLGAVAGAIACYLLARTALLESESSARLSGVADALSISGSDWDRFEKAVLIFVPKRGHVRSLDFLAMKELKPFLDLLKRP